MPSQQDAAVEGTGRSGGSGCRPTSSTADKTATTDGSLLPRCGHTATLQPVNIQLPVWGPLVLRLCLKQVSLNLLPEYCSLFYYLYWY